MIDISHIDCAKYYVWPSAITGHWVHGSCPLKRDGHTIHCDENYWPFATTADIEWMKIQYGLTRQ